MPAGVNSLGLARAISAGQRGALGPVGTGVDPSSHSGLFLFQRGLGIQVHLQVEGPLKQAFVLADGVKHLPSP